MILGNLFSYIMDNFYKWACIIFIEIIKSDYSFYKSSEMVKLIPYVFLF